MSLMAWENSSFQFLDADTIHADSLMTRLSYVTYSLGLCHFYLLCLRSTRESTPCNLTRGTEEARTPGSTTKTANRTESSGRLQNSTRRHIPTAHEMDEFFGPAEEEQLRQFTEKYNFDPVSEKPHHGRYEWEKLDR